MSPCDRVLVTGGASGLGAATAERFAKEGAHVLVFDRDAKGAEEVAGRIGGRAVVGDVTDEAAVARAMATDVAMGPLRVVVAAAGIGWAQRTLAFDGAAHGVDAFRRVLEVNLLGTFVVLRTAAAVMARQEPVDGVRGVLVATASAAAMEGQAGQVAYAASKAGVVGMTLPMARDLAPVGIRVFTVAPGLFDTPLLGMLPQDKRDALASQVLTPPRLGKAEEFADLVAALVRNPYVNGEVVRLDGGLRLPPR